MARGINKVILIGNLGNDPEVRYLPSGSAVASISLATSESWKDKQTGETQERTEWHRVKLFNRLGEIAGEYLRKGSKVYIEGRLQTSKYQDKNGVERYSTDIVANEMQMLDARGAGGSNDAANNFSSERAAGGASRNTQSSMAEMAMPAQADFDDDIPF